MNNTEEKRGKVEERGEEEEEKFPKMWKEEREEREEREEKNIKENFTFHCTHTPLQNINGTP